MSQQKHLLVSDRETHTKNCLQAKNEHFSGAVWVLAPKALARMIHGDALVIKKAKTSREREKKNLSRGKFHLGTASKHLSRAKC